MEDLRAHLVRIVEAHLEEILDRLMQAYTVEIPRVAEASAEERALIREAARRTSVAFLEVYARGDRVQTEAIDDARRVTVARAGELFDREDIIAMLRIANQVMFQTARALVEKEMGADPSRAADIEQALNGFLGELERSERLIPGGDHALGELLTNAEAEDPDIR